MGKKYEKVGKGSFFHEDNQGNEKRPSFKGKVEISGRGFEMALWPRVGKGGHRYLSCVLTLPGQRDQIGDAAFFERNNPNPKAPKLSGPMEIQGVKFDGSVWQQKAENGTEYFSLKVEHVTEGE